MALGWRGGENVSANGWANGVMDQPRQGMRHRTPPRRLRVLPPSEPRHTPDPCGIRRAVTHRDFTSDEVKAAEKAIDKLLQEGASTALSTGTCTAAPDFLSGAAVRNQPGSGRYTYQPGCGSVTSRELTQQSTAKSTGRAGYPRKVGIREKQQRVQKEKLQGCSARGFKFASARWRSQFTLRGARPVEDGDTNGRLPKIPTVAHGSEQAGQARARQLRNAKPSRAVDSIQQRTTLQPSFDPKKLAQAREEMNAVGARQRKIKLRWKWKGGKMLKEIDCFYAARLNMARLDPAEIRGLVRARATLAKENTELLDQSRCAQIEIVHKDMLKELFAGEPHIHIDCRATYGRSRY